MAKTLVASINGVSLKKLRYFVGHEGGCFQGDVYLDGKKLGFWSQDSWGGADNFEFSQVPIIERAKQYYAAHPQIDELKLYGMKLEDIDFTNLPKRNIDNMVEIDASLMGELVELTETLKWFKKWTSQGYPVLGKLTFIHGNWPIPKEDDTICGAISREAVDKKFKEFTTKYPYARVEYYEKPEDFIKVV